MKKFSLLIILQLSFLTYSHNSDVPRFTKSKIGNSDCYAYFPTQNPIINVSYSEDSSAIYTYEEYIGNHTFSLIQVDFSEAINDSLEQQTILISYLEYLKQQFDIAQYAGYGYGHSLESNPKTHGVIDYWEDSNKTQFAVKAWANSKHITVFFIFGKEEYPYLTVSDLFFDGIRY